MCGLVGTFKGCADEVEKGLKKIAHRGPDGSGTAVHGDMIHGHVRLAVLDPTVASAQPFRYRDSVLSYNGELWNHQELRTELETLGHKFRTCGDTEVVAAALYEWGPEAFPRLDGMFALAWSKKDDCLLARDRFGKIPLYVFRKGGGFRWASERKAFDSGGYMSPLPPGSWLDLRTGRLHEWYRVEEHLGAKADPLEALEQAVHKRLVADVPVCCLISGGLDSTLILTLAKKYHPDIAAYTAYFDPDSEDLKYARLICKELSVPLVEVRLVGFPPEALIRAIRTIEIPTKAQVEISLLCLPLAARIREDGFKVCLSGEAADELFGGYGNMCIQGSKADDAVWRIIRLRQLEKMSRGNFIRCNKVFMAHGVECRLPFMEKDLVETVLAMGKSECPPGKKLLKQIAKGIIPDQVIKRRKETFQGGSGISQIVSQIICYPNRFFNAECRELFGAITTG